MAMRDYMKPQIQMRQFSFRKTRWQKIKETIKRWLLKLIGKNGND